MTRAPQMPTKKRIAKQLFLRGKTELKWKTSEQDRNIRVALMVHTQNIRTPDLHVFGTTYTDPHRRCPQDHLCPDPGAAVLDSAGGIDDGTGDRNRSHDDGINKN